MNLFIKVFLFFAMLQLGFNNLQTVNYGSDTSVSIVNPMNIPTSSDNIIKTFACAKNGFAFQDLHTSCSWQSIFPVSGPISLKGGNLYLMSDLTLNNTGSFTDLGIVYGADHVVNLSEYNTTFHSGTIPGGTVVLNTVAGTTLTRPSRSFDWSYDGKYVAVGITGGTGNEINIYEFTGASLILRAGTSVPANPDINSIRWRPNSYFLVLAESKNNIRSYQFTPPSTLTAGGTASFTTPYAIAFQKRGTHVAVGGTAATINVYSFTATGGGSFSLVATSTNTLNGTVQNDALVWAPTGNKNDLIAVTNNAGTNGSVHLYNFTGSTLRHVKGYIQSKAANTMDWAATSTYVAVGFADGTIRTYQHTASTSIITQKTSNTITGAVNSVNFKANGTELAVARAVAATSEFQLYSFNTSTYALTEIYPISLTTDAFCVRFYTNGADTYIARSDNATLLLTVYKENVSPFIFRDVNLFLNGDLTLGSPLLFTGNCSVNAQNNSITFTSAGSFNIAPNTSLSVALANMKFSTPGTFSMQGGTSNLIFQNAKLELNEDVLLSNGKFDVYDELTITGPHTFAYASGYTSTIHSNSALTIDNGTVFQIGKTKTTTIEPLYFENTSSQLNINNATLNVTNSGLTIKKGIVNITNNSTIDLGWTDTNISATMQGLHFGDGINPTNNSFLVVRGNGTQLTTTNGAIVFDSVSSHSSVQFYGQPQFRVGSNVSVYAKNPLEFVNGWMLLDPSVKLLIAPGSYTTFNNTELSALDMTGDHILTGSALNLYTAILDKNDKYDVSGNVPFVIINIARDGNTITGNGSIAGYLTFSSNQSQVTWDCPKHLNFGNVGLNGGRIIFAEDSGMLENYIFTQSGTVDLMQTTFNLGTQHSNWTSNIYWIGNGATLELNSNVSLSGIWTFSGSMVIEGGGYLLDVGTTGTIILERGAQLELRNISLYNLTRKNRIICNDNNCQVILNFSDLLLAGDYLWDKGSFFVYFDSDINILDGLDSTFTFSYASTQTSTIDSFCKFEIGRHLRFSIGRQNSSITNINAQPLIFNDPASSKLILNGGTLHVTSSGMIMTRGIINAINNSYIEIDNTVYPYGLTLGDGIQAHDFVLEIGSGAQLEIVTGKLFYNCYDNNNIIFDSPMASINVNSIDGLVAKTNLKLENGTIYSSGTAISKYGNPSVVLSKIIRQIQAPHAVLNISVHDVSPYYKLSNGDSFYVAEGYTTKAVLADSGLSNFGGVAGFDGTLTLKNSGVTLQSSLSTPLFSSPTLNGGTFVVLSDGSFAADNTFTGSGKVQFLGTKLSFGTQDTKMTHTIYWSGTTSGEINLNARTNLYGSWQIGGNIELNGNGKILDLSSGGIITIRPNSTLSLENISLKGLGGGYGTINFMDKTSTLKLTNAYLEFDNNLSTTIGGIYVDGPSCVGLKNYNWTLDNNASMTIKGVTLWQDTLDQINHGKIRFGAGSIGKYLTLVSSGTIKTAANLDILTTDTNLQGQIRNNSNAIVYWTPINRTTSNSVNYWAPITRTVSNAENWLNTRVRTDSNAFAYGIKNSSNAVKRLADHFITINDANFYIVNGISGNTTLNGRSLISSPIDLQGGTLTLNGDMILSSHTTIPSSGNFDLNSYAMILSGDVSLPDNIKISVKSNGIIDGQGNTININTLGKISIDNNITLTLRNMNLLGYGSWPIEMKTQNSILALQDVITCFARDFTFSQGKLFIQNDVMITGSSKFSYASTATSFIASHSTLYFDKNTTFSYSPRLTSRHTLSERNLIKMTDKTSGMFFDGCLLQLPDSGMQLTNGSIYFDNKVTLNGRSTQNESFEWGNGTTTGELDINILGGAFLENNGYIYHNAA